MLDRPCLAIETYTIKHVNDGKEKWQSHEQHFSADIGQPQIKADAYIQMSIVAYGKSEAESRQELIEALRHCCTVVSAAISELEDQHGSLS